MSIASETSLQETPLLSTKYSIPPARPDRMLVRRLQLLERLEEGLLWAEEGTFGRKLTLISAPAGYGKTTLLSEWAHGRGAAGAGRSAAWLSLEEDDNDPARFLSYLVAALREVHGGIGAGLLSALRSPRPPTRGAIMAALINEIATRPAPTLLFLDDYHLITTQPIHEVLTFLLDHMPANLHLVIATRADPPLPIARLRGRGQLNELRLTDLRFAAEEADAFLTKVMDLPLSAGEVNALAARTEGWAAGLQMAAVSIQGQAPDRTAHFVRAFAGSDRHILDYLVEEVIQGQGVDVQTFLLHTAVLDRLTAPLCDVLLNVKATGDAPLGYPTERDSAIDDVSQGMLEYLEAANLFLVPLDNERRWYRYHRLFADLLRRRLVADEPVRAAELHDRASRWHEAHGSMGNAIRHALAAADMERAADLVEREAEATLMRSEISTLLRWTQRLPEALVAARPSLSVYCAWALLLGGRPFDEVEARLAGLGTSAEDATAPFSARTAPLLAFIAIFQGRLIRARELSGRALAELPEEKVFLRSMAAWSQGIALLAEGEVTQGTEMIQEAGRISRQGGNLMVTIMVLCYTGELYMKQGKLYKAQATYQHALEIAMGDNGQALPIAGEALLGLGIVALEWNRLEEAGHYLKEGIELGRHWGEISALDGYLALERLHRARNDLDAARNALAKAEEIAIKFDATDVDDMVVAMQQAQLAISEGRLEAAARWAESRGLSPEGALQLDQDAVPAELADGEERVNYHLFKYEYLILARLYLAQGEQEQALAVLQPAQRLFERRGRIGNLIEALVLEALARAPDELEGAVEILERALALAEEGGHVRVFLDEGQPMLRLLEAAANRRIQLPYVRLLLAEAEGPPLERQDAAPDSPLIEPLSAREMEVLAQLAAGLSNKEIAAELFIALSTVKKHLKNIYGKLDVHSRTQAVGRARELNLFKD